jgi:hypothetical protein
MAELDRESWRFVKHANDGRYIISAQATCGHKETCYLDDKPTKEEVAEIVSRIQGTTCCWCLHPEFRR